MAITMNEARARQLKVGDRVYRENPPFKGVLSFTEYQVVEVEDTYVAVAYALHYIPLEFKHMPMLNWRVGDEL